MKQYKVPASEIKKWQLDPEEIEILEGIENGEYKSVPISPEERQQMQQAARNTLARLKKEKSITLRMNEQDLSKLKTIAAQEGLPYQTLISSILHKYVTQTSMVRDK